MPQILKETAEAVTVVPFERVQQRTFELIADVSQFREETVEVEWLVPREPVQRRINEQKWKCLTRKIRRMMCSEWLASEKFFVGGRCAFE